MFSHEGCAVVAIFFGATRFCIVRGARMVILVC